MTFIICAVLIWIMKDLRISLCSDWLLCWLQVYVLALSNDPCTVHAVYNLLSHVRNIQRKSWMLGS